jgi:hypothetical protein
VPTAAGRSCRASNRRQLWYGNRVVSGIPVRKSNLAGLSNTVGTTTVSQNGRGRSAPPPGRAGPGGAATSSLTKVPAPTREVMNPSPVSRS